MKEIVLRKLGQVGFFISFVGENKESEERLVEESI
jgi:hypothetical protein